MRKRDFLKKRAERTKDQSYYQAARNVLPNNAIKYAKRKYFNDSLATNKKDPHKTLQIINELNSRQPNNKVIADIDITWQEAYLVFILNRNTILSQLTRPVLF